MLISHRFMTAPAALVCLLLLWSAQPARAALWHSGSLPAPVWAACALHRAHWACFEECGLRPAAFPASDAAGPAAGSVGPLICYLDYILALENFVQGFILLAYYLRDPTDVVTLIVAGLTFSVALSRYFDYLECLIEE